jgi:predicted CxxxxCH...CXXCH cytochrome family protein
MSLILLVAFAGIAGCGDDQSSGGMSSPPDWVVVPSGGRHAKSATLTYIANDGSSSCIECHGADLSGGTSQVSCFGNPTGCHHGPVADWVVSPPAAQNHGVAAKKAPGSSGFASCQICHGADFRTPRGDGSRTCYSCHGLAPHPNGPWRASAGSLYGHVGTDNANASVCYDCHAYTGTANPNNPHIPPTPAPTGTAPGCYNGTMCHNDSSGPAAANHLTPFDNTDHYSVDSTTFQANCGVCHAVTGTSPVSGAPLCTTCHTAGSPLAALNCTSCHGDPPSGAAYPNVAGEHAVHGALPGVGVCNPCHNGLEAGSPAHYERANARDGKNALRVPPGDVAFLAAYDAESGQASFDAANRTCSNVICHGGQATPDWQTAIANAIDVPNACLACHTSGTSQYNSYNSGKHGRHLDSGIFGVGLSAAAKCKLCHDEAKVNVSGHFQNLATPGFEQSPQETILLAVGYNGDTCNPQAGGLTGCHGNKKW